MTRYWVPKQRSALFALLTLFFQDGSHFQAKIIAQAESDVKQQRLCCAPWDLRVTYSPVCIVTQSGGQQHGEAWRIRVTDIEHSRHNQCRWRCTRQSAVWLQSTGTWWTIVHSRSALITHLNLNIELLTMFTYAPVLNIVVKNIFIFNTMMTVKGRK